MLVVVWLVLLPSGALGCGPGRLGARRRVPRKLTPLVFKQHVPNVPENSLAASGPPGERIRRGDPHFGELVPNYNRDIVFKDRSSNGADRLATQRLKEVLDTLAISVMNQWPGVRLRVTEGWSEEGFHHAARSLHLRGRAADLTTSDRDPAKCGQLARLAVEAGCDWVYYEARSHIHCSVKREHTSHTKSYGCFHGNATVLTKQGLPKQVSDLKQGDVIASGFLPDRSLSYSPVVGFLHKDPDGRTRFLRITTGSGRRITLTPDHLIFKEGDGFVSADHVRSGDVLLTTADGDVNGSSDRNIGSGYHDVEPVGTAGSTNPVVEVGSIWDVIKPFMTGSTDQGVVQPIVADGSSEQISEIVGTPESSNWMVNCVVLAGSSDEVGKTGSEDNEFKWAGSSDRVVESGSSGTVVEPVQTSENSDRFINADETVGSSDLVEKSVSTAESSVQIVESVLADGSVIKPDDDLVKPVMTARSSIRVVRTLVTSVETVTSTGVYAPLTADGTAFVDGVWTSCYAVVSSHQMAHAAMFPLRWTHVIWEILGGLGKVLWVFQTEARPGENNVNEKEEYMHWYAKVLFWVYRLLYDE